jgi:hypothetical protein
VTIIFAETKKERRSMRNRKEIEMIKVIGKNKENVKLQMNYLKNFISKNKAIRL